MLRSAAHVADSLARSAFGSASGYGSRNPTHLTAVVESTSEQRAASDSPAAKKALESRRLCIVNTVASTCSATLRRERPTHKGPSHDVAAAREVARPMESKHASKSAAIRARLSHPIIDSDGHQVESDVIFRDYLKDIGGPSMVERFRNVYYDSFFDPRWGNLSPLERHERRSMRPTWRALPTRHTQDLATAMFPKLFHERLPELGLDFSVVYPTLGLLAIQIADDEVRAAVCRALNKMKVDMFAGYTDRLLPVATIPMHTPKEAIAELEYAVGELGLKAIMMASYVRRPIKAAMRISPEAGRYSYWIDTFGLDSEYNYDPVWAKCLELKVSPTFHSVGY